MRYLGPALLALALSVSTVAHAQSVSTNDLSSYTAIPNVVPGTSYIRLFGVNGDTDFQIRAFGNATGTEYTAGTPAVVHVTENSSPQLSYSQLNAEAQISGTNLMPSGADASVTLYVKTSNSALAGMYQHVLFNSQTSALENMSTCAYNPLTTDFSTLNRIVMNAHTTQLSDYPSTINITNPDATARKVQIEVFDAPTGVAVGTTFMDVTVPANGSTPLTMAQIENAINWQPTASQTQANLFLNTGDSQAYDAIISHTVQQSETGTISNMTVICPINRPASSTGSYDPCNPPVNGIATTVNGVATVVRLQVGEITGGCPITDMPANTSTPGYMGGPQYDTGSDIVGVANGEIAPVGDDDWYQVQLTSGQTYHFILTGNIDASINLGALQNGTMNLRDPNGNLLTTTPWTGRPIAGGILSDWTYTVPANTPTGQTDFIEIYATDGISTGIYQASIYILQQ